MKIFSISFLFICSLISIFIFDIQTVSAKANGGDITITGTVLDDDTGKPLEFAAISLYDESGEQLISGVLATIDGDFEFTNVPAGEKYNLVVNYLGYAPAELQVDATQPSQEIRLGRIGLLTDAAVIEQVEVTGTRSVVQMQIDRRVFNVDQDISSRGGSGIDVMRNIPGVIVDADGEVSLRNASVQILVNGRPTPLSLDQIPADQIQSIEVITNPSARFEASATGGIINVILKENLRDNINGTINAGIGYPERYNAGINIGSKFGKVNTSLSYNYDFRTYTPDGNSLRDVYNEEGEIASYYYQYQDRTRLRDNHSIRLATDWSVSPKDQISLSGTYNMSDRFDDEIITYESGAPGNPLFTGQRNLEDQRISSGFSLQSMYFRNFNKDGHTFSVDVTYQENTSEGEDDYTYNQFDMQGQVWDGYPYYQLVTTSLSSRRIDGQFDYVLPFSDDNILEAGGRSFVNYQYVENLVEILPDGETDYETDPFLSQTYEIREMIHAMYGNFTGKQGLWKYQAGVRFEYSDYQGDILGTDESFSYTYPSGNLNSLLKAFFPSFYIARELKVGQTLQFSVSRKINRPGRWQLMPNVSFRDNQNIRVGNPNVNPEFMNLAELSYQNIFEKGSWVTSAYGRYISDPFTWVNLPYEQDSSILVFTPINGEKRINFGWENIFRYNITPKFEFTLSSHAYFALLDAEIDGAIKRTQGWMGVLRPMLRYQLPANFTVQANGFYMSPRILPQGRTNSMYSFDASVSKQIGTKWTIILSVSDILDSRYWGSTTETGNIVQSSERRNEVRNFRLNVSYRFGVEDQRDRQRRMRNSSLNGGEDMMEM